MARTTQGDRQLGQPKRGNSGPVSTLLPPGSCCFLIFELVIWVLNPIGLLLAEMSRQVASRWEDIGFPLASQHPHLCGSLLYSIHPSRSGVLWEKSQPWLSRVCQFLLSCWRFEAPCTSCPWHSWPIRFSWLFGAPFQEVSGSNTPLLLSLWHCTHQCLNLPSVEHELLNVTCSLITVYTKPDFSLIPDTEVDFGYTLVSPPAPRSLANLLSHSWNFAWTFWPC